MGATPAVSTSSSPSGHLDLSTLPPIFVSATHLDTEDLHDLEDQIIEAAGTLTYDVSEAKIVLTKAERKRRIELDFRSKGLTVEQVFSAQKCDPVKETSANEFPPAKRQKLMCRESPRKDAEKSAVVDEDASTASEAEQDTRANLMPAEKELPSTQNSCPVSSPLDEDMREQFTGTNIKVLKLQWFEDSFRAGRILSIGDYLTYEGYPIKNQESGSSTAALSKSQVLSSARNPAQPRTILERAQADATARQNFSHGYGAVGRRRVGGNNPSTDTSFAHGASGNLEKSKYAHLLTQTTSEHDQGASSDVPEMPEWVVSGVKYACERSTPPTSPNNDFIALLKKIKLARLLTHDEIGVRAYSTSIASLAAYPYKISNPREILYLPGCDAKIANLYIEYINTGCVKAAEDAENNEELKVLRLFYDIWGVGATTARDFYYNRGWRELDDIVEFGWSTLSRVQQIGVKYYSEFLEPIPRQEVEAIAATIKKHAIKVRDRHVQTLVVGGYRRGKEACGDVDIIVSHPEEKQTIHIINDIVASLEEEGWITHTLLLSLTSSNRGQQTLPFVSGSGGHGFDTLDKALVVWQDPVWSTKEADVAADPKAKNPNIHRRVDIIISPWRTVGCAVTGWSGGTTFQRDLRRYAKNIHSWKFDSSGIRDRGSGKVVDVEGWEHEETRAKTMEEAERRVFEGMGLVYREPWERCTG